MAGGIYQGSYAGGVPTWNAAMFKSGRAKLGPAFGSGLHTAHAPKVGSSHSLRARRCSVWNEYLGDHNLTSPMLENINEAATAVMQTSPLR